VNPTTAPFGVKIRNQSSHDLARFRHPLGHQLDIEAVRLEDNNEASLVLLPVASVEEGVVDGFASANVNHAQNSGFRR